MAALDFPQFKALVKELKLGKRLPDAVYLHTTALEQCDPALRELVASLKEQSQKPIQFNVIKLFTRDFRVSLLHYPTFFDDAYPALAESGL